MATPDKVLNDTVTYLAGQRKLSYKSSQVDRHKGFFVRRRAETLGNANPAWVTAPDQPDLRKRVLSEFDLLDTFLTTKAKSLDPTKGGADLTPPHLDLHDFAGVKYSTSAGVVKDKEQAARIRRTYWIRSIGWRAAAIHADKVWQGPTSSTTATLLDKPLAEIIDRRLRLLERMSYQVSRADVLGGSWAFSGSGASGPWKDGFRKRVFEYPRTPSAPVGVTAQVAGFVGAANIASENDPSFKTGGKPWQWEPGHKRLDYNVPPWPGNRFPSSVAGDWKWETARSYWLDLKPSGTAAAAIDNLFTPNDDWWGRSWLFCDQVLDALHIEELLFALRRRSPSAESAFNALVTSKPGYVALGGFVVSFDLSIPRHLTGDTADPYFDNIEIAEADLQVGDHLVFYNSFVYQDVAIGEWQLENSIVMDIDSDYTTSSIQRGQIHLQGHGTAESKYSTFQNVIADQLNDTLESIRQKIVKTLASTPSTTAIDWNNKKGIIVHWEPYEPFAAPGAWWVQMNLVDQNGDARWSTVQEALNAVPGAYATDPFAGTGYNPPPSNDAVFFPLYVPAVDGQWDGYFGKRRHRGSSYHPPKNLSALKAGGAVVPGLFPEGEHKPIRVVRPKFAP
jgi:hypothetical protein